MTSRIVGRWKQIFECISASSHGTICITRRKWVSADGAKGTPLPQISISWIIGLMALHLSLHRGRKQGA